MHRILDFVRRLGNNARIDGNGHNSDLCGGSGYQDETEVFSANNSDETYEVKALASTQRNEESQTTATAAMEDSKSSSKPPVAPTGQEVPPQSASDFDKKSSNGVVLEPTQVMCDHYCESVQAEPTKTIPSETDLKTQGESSPPALMTNDFKKECSVDMEETEQQILSLIDAHEAKRIQLTKLPALYKSAYHYPLGYKQLGFKELKDMLNNFQSISMPNAQPGYEYACRVEKSFELEKRSGSTCCVEFSASKLSSPIINASSNANVARGEEEVDDSSQEAPSSNDSPEEFPPSIAHQDANKELENQTPALDVREPTQHAYLTSYPANEDTSSFTRSHADQIKLTEQRILALIDAEVEKKVLMSKLPGQYYSLHCTQIPYKELGCRKLKDLIDLFPAISMPKARSGFQYICRVDESSIQRKIPATLSSASASTDFGAESQDKTSQSPSPQKNAAFSLFEERVLALIDSAPDKRVALCDIPSKFLSAYSCEIPYTELGHTKLKNVLSSIPSVSLFTGGKYIYNDHYFVRRANQSSQSIALEDNPGFECNSNGQRTTDALDDVSSLIKAVSEELSSSAKLYPRLVSFLSRKQEGATGSQVMKEVLGLAHFIRSRATQAGRDFLSPVAILRGCKGIERRMVDGRNLFFLAGTDCSKADASDHSNIIVEHGSASVDAIAALEILGRLHGKFCGRQWPASKKELKKFISGIDTDNSPSLACWTDNIKPEKKKKEICKRLTEQLKKMGCLGGTNKSLSWKLEEISKTIEERNAVTVPSVENLAGSSLGMDGSSKTVTVSTGDVPVEDNGLSNAKMTSAADTPVVRIDSAEKLESMKFEAADTPVVLVDSVEKLESLKFVDPFCSRPSEGAAGVVEHDVVAIDCEGVPDSLFLIQIATATATYVFDCIKTDAAGVCGFLAPLLMNKSITKLFHDLHNDAAAMAHIGGVQPLRGTFDTQLAVELLTGDLHVGFNQMLQQFECAWHPLKSGVKQKMDGGLLFAKRPLAPDVLEYAVLDVVLLLDAKDRLFNMLGDMRSKVQQASDSRALLSPQTGGARQICFDVANSHMMTSLELLQEVRPDDMLVPAPLKVSDDTSVLLNMLPEDLRGCLVDQTQLLSDIAIDKGRSPLAWVNGNRLFLGEDTRIVTADDIECVVAKLGGFGSDNRAGLEQQLHRISAVRNRQCDIIGLTMRVGRHVTGNATILSDLLFGDRTKSILFLGEPGSGKTTVVREVTRLLADQFNVWIVDTSNEIAGDGDVPHPCVGLARRMMVPRLEKQSEVLIECVQNHTPEIMVIDEIGRPTEVEAARTCKQRGVRLVASAHGDLRKLVRNPKLRGLIGGVETVTLGDNQARLESEKLGKPKGAVQKLKAQRAGSPTFDIIVELRRGAHHEWQIVMDVGEAVDKILEGQQYLAQRRVRDPRSGALMLNLEKA